MKSIASRTQRTKQNQKGDVRFLASCRTGARFGMRFSQGRVEVLQGGRERSLRVSRLALR